MMADLANVTDEEFREFYFNLSENDKQELRDFAKGARRFVCLLEDMGEIEASA
jgi:hypothetical protein